MKRVAVVTGAGSGIGRAVSNGLHQCGFYVFGIDLTFPLSSPDDDEGCAVGLTKFSCDVLDVPSLERIAKNIEGSHGKVDVLINCAAVFTKGGLLELEIEDWRRSIEVNLGGPFIVSKVLLPLIKQSSSGSVVMIGSPWANASSPTGARVAYSASKAGVLGLTRSLAFDLSRYGIRVNMVTPGVIATEMLIHGMQDLLGPADRDEVLHIVGNSQPLGRVGEPNDILQAIFFLVSEAASWITGAELVVDGGGSLKFGFLPTQSAISPNGLPRSSPVGDKTPSA
jgi:3alpha(or 20beta)-hydroxysteroid dehydrogenase